MKKNQSKNNTKRYDKLTKNSVAEDYCKTLEEMYTDVVSIPMFNNGDVHIDDWKIGFFTRITNRNSMDNNYVYDDIH